MNKKILFLFLLISASLFSQKKVLDHTVYNDWKRIGDTKISEDGKYTVYTIKPHRGDGYLYIVNNESGKKDSVFRAINPVFAGDNSYVAFQITAGFDTLRKSELNKVKKDKWPKDSLGIFYFANSELQKFDKLKSFEVVSNSDVLIYLKDDNSLPAVKEKRRLFSFKKKKEEEKYDSDGKLMIVVSAKKAEKPVKDVNGIYLPEKGDYIVYTQHKKIKKKAEVEIIVNQLNDNESWKIPAVFTDVTDIIYNEKGNEIVFTASVDTFKHKPYQLYYADLKNNRFSQLIDSGQTNFPKDFHVSNNYEPRFSRDGKRIFFGVAPKPLKEPKDTLLTNEKAVVDVWNWQDERLQPQQLKEKETDLKKSLLSVYDLERKKMLVLAEDTLTIRTLDRGNAPYALGYSMKQYQKFYNWEFPGRRDYYRINVATGEKQLLKTALIHDAELSPTGKYFIFSNPKDNNQYILDVNAGIEKCLTCMQKAQWWEDVNGMPYVAEPLGTIGWTENEAAVLIQSKYDIWKYDVNTALLTNLTQSAGTNDKIRFALREWNKDSVYLNYENIYFTGFHEKDKSMSLYKVSVEGDQLTLSEKWHTDHQLSGFKKAKKADLYIYQQASLIDYPDVHLADWKKNITPRQISKANPQQSEYNWATVELISWKAYDKTPLEGLLYKPENYDSTKNYPLLVYFYEMYSDDLHNHSSPRPTASIIFPTEYASAGYMVLIPDIRYNNPGQPGKDAYNSIMSATDYVLKKYPNVDSLRMGLQGQSWGGYQTAQLITMTTRYRAAMAGAPVANMFSAYGGIRWGSGLNRQFQYERTQSRIGKTIWEAPGLYVENSPLFGLPKVTTPLLIMHNDADGAVPWYQGIELFTALKRLNKPVWMLNYNGDDHNLMKNANRIDLSIRMRQFFDYYLQHAPEPVWMKTGVPAVEKGKTYGLGY